MSKAVRHENPRVVVSPIANRGPLHFTYDELRRDCDAIAAQIARHVDDVGTIRIESDRLEFCEHCDCKWTEAGALYNGGCCDEDEAAEQARLTPAARSNSL